MYSFKRAIPIVFGIISTFLAVAICTAIVLYTNFFLQSISAIFIIPIGGIIVGTFCGSGVFWGLRVSNLRAEKKHYILSCAFAILGFVLSYLSLYLLLRFKSHSSISISFFIHEFVLQRASIIRIRGFISKPYELGSAYNLIKIIFEMIGFLCGGLLAGIITLGEKRYCDKCKLYLLEKKLYSSSAKLMERYIDELDNVFKSKDLTKEYISNAKREGRLEKKSACKDGNPYYNVSLSYCPNCLEGFIIIKEMEKNEKKYEEAKQFRQVIKVSDDVVRNILELL